MIPKYEHNSKIYAPREIENVLELAVNDSVLKGNAKKVYYYNIPCAFDIETTSFYRDIDGNIYDYSQRCKLPKNAKFEKLATMYIWQFGINGYIVVGRTWSEFTEMVATIERKLDLCDNRRLMIFVHNLSYEFQFIRRLFTWSNVFSTDVRQPLYALTNTGVEFRCSYMLSGYSLETVAKNLVKYKVAKLVGNLDYSLLRNSLTPLSENEIAYCVNDVKIVMLYILEYLDRVKTLHNLPLTKTGGVRKYCRKECFYYKTETDTKQRFNYKYKDMITGLKINSLDEFKALQRAFCGGFTHANANYVDKVVKDVASYDFTSSYPYVMVSEMYPMSTPFKMSVKSLAQYEFIASKFLCVFDVEFTDIFAKETYENYISVSKCYVKENYSENNGRLVCAKRICLTITNIDFNIIKVLYSWREIRIGIAYVYEKAYLPTEFVKAILTLYKKKTELKGVDGMEQEYLNAKEMLNSCYGMCVTNPLRDSIEYNAQNEWIETKLTDSQKLETLLKYNTDRKRFLYYVWGVFVTAYARRNLFTAIHELKHDYIYSDTDSVKFVMQNKHLAYFEKYNRYAENKLKQACKYHEIDFAMCKPKTIKGVEKLLGIWDFEGVYKRFKTLGAKRYMVESENALTGADGKKYDYSLTVAGVNKKFAIPYLVDKYKSDIFAAFTNYLHIPPTASGKSISTYIDYETKGTLTDYLGNTAQFDEKSAVHLEQTDYTLNISSLFLRYLTGINIVLK